MTEDTFSYAVVFAALCVICILSILNLIDRRGRRSTWRERRPQAPAAAPDPRDAATQLRAVMSAGFARKRVMHRDEYRVFRLVEQEVQSNWRGCRVFSQTALGEVIESRDRNAHAAINSKRADVLVVDGSGLPMLAVEFQGKGHYQADAAARDAVKREALRRAGVEYLEVHHHTPQEQVVADVRAALGRVAGTSKATAA